MHQSTGLGWPGDIADYEARLKQNSLADLLDEMVEQFGPLTEEEKASAAKVWDDSCPRCEHGVCSAHREQDHAAPRPAEG